MSALSDIIERLSKKAAIEASEAEAKALERQLVKDQLSQANYEEFHRPARVEALNEVNKANSGFRNAPQIIGEMPSKQADLESVFPPRIVPPAEQAADVLNSAHEPNFNLGGPKSSPVNPNQALTLANQKGVVPGQNFTLEGGPQSHGFTFGDVPKGGLPAVNGPKDLSMRGSGDIIDVTPMTPQSRSKLLTYGLPVATTAGTVGALWGAGELMGDDQAQQLPPIPLRNDYVPEQQAPPQAPAPAAPAAKNSNSLKAKASGPGGVGAASTAPVEPGMNIDFGGGHKDNAEALADAQKRENLAVFANQLGKAGDIIGSSIAGVGPKAQEAFDSNIKQAGEITKQHEALMAKEKNDPNSPLSKGMRQFMKSFGFNIKGEATAEELMKLSPLAEKYFQSVQNREQRAEEVKQKQLDRQTQMSIAKLNKETANEVKRGDKLETYTQAFRKEMTNGQLGKQYATASTAQKMLKSLSEFAKDPSGYTDYATLMGSLKTLQGDESVVKEAEIRLGMEAGSLKDTLLNYGQKLVNGKSLQPEQREKIISTVRILGETAKTQYIDSTSGILDHAKTLGLNPKHIMPGNLLDDESPQDSSPKINSLIDSRSEEDNQKRLKELRYKYGPQ